VVHEPGSGGGSGSGQTPKGEHRPSTSPTGQTGGAVQAGSEREGAEPAAFGELPRQLVRTSGLPRVHAPDPQEERVRFLTGRVYIGSIYLADFS
jgi:hypothetical protein